MTLSPRPLRAVFFVFALLFVVLLPFYPHYPGGWVVKAIPALSLAILTWRFVRGIERRWLSLALLFSAAGDAVLGWNDLYGGAYFVIGLVLFLVAQILFIAAFATSFQLQRSRIPVAALLTVYSVVLAWLLWPHLGEMALPVFVYIVVITVRAIVAALRTMKGNALLLGALAFMFSDSLLAVNKFWTPVPAASYGIISYYVAQYMIAHAFLGNDRVGGVGPL
jgi:uncharacterized membrane protein YhhN